MQIIREWTLAVCMACVAAGILQHFGGKNERFSVIKLVLTLYILVTAFAPLQALRFGDTRALPNVSQAAEAAAPLDTGQLVLQQAGAQLESTLQSACAAANAPLQSVQVVLTQGDGQVEVSQVIFVPQDAAQTAEAANAMKEVLGSSVPINAKERET